MGFVVRWDGGVADRLIDQPGLGYSPGNGCRYNTTYFVTHVAEGWGHSNLTRWGQPTLTNSLLIARGLGDIRATITVP
jgi:hypothetical protein